MATQAKSKSIFTPTTENPIVETTREFWLAGLGAMSLAQQEGEKLRKHGKKMFDELVTKGKKFEQNQKKQIRKRYETAAGQVAETTKKVEQKAQSKLKKAAGLSETVEVYHLVSKGESWTIRREGEHRDISLHDNKASALEAARGIAHAHEPSRVVVHRADGTIQTSYTYE